MNKYLNILLIIVVIAICFSGCSQKIQENTSINKTNPSSNETNSNSNTIAVLNWSRYVDVEHKVSIDVPDNFTAEKTLSNSIKIYSQPRLQERLGTYIFVDPNSPFWQSLKNSNSYVSDTVLYIDSQNKWTLDPSELVDNEVQRINHTEPNTKARRNNTVIGGVPAIQLIIESPNNPYWVKNYLEYNGKLYTIAYGEYKLSQYDQISKTLSHMLETIKFTDGDTIPAGDIKYITVPPTIKPVAPLENEVLNKTIILKQGDIRKYWNSYQEEAVIEIHSDIPISILYTYANAVQRVDEVSDLKNKMGDTEFVLMNNNYNPAKITIKIVTVKCQDKSLSCLNQIEYYRR